MRCLFGFLLVCTLLAPSAAPARAQEKEQVSETLPPGVVARVHGRDVTEEQLLERLARDYENTERGRGVLQQLVDDLCVADEAAQRDVTVTQAEIDDYVQHWDETVRKQSGGKASIHDVYAGSTKQEFLAAAREFLLRQKLAREDLGSKPGEELSEHYMKLWLSSLRRRKKVQLSDLPPGVLATIGERRIDRMALARTLRSKLPREMVHSARQELVVAIATERHLEQNGVTVTDDHVEAAIQRMRERFAEDPQVQGTGVTFDQFLQRTKGFGEDDLRGDFAFRARIGLRRLLTTQVKAERIRAHWELNRELYGERALVRQVFIGANDKQDFDLPTFREAWREALGVKVDVITAAGLDRPEADRPVVALGPIVSAVAKRLEASAEKRQRAGEASVWTRLTVEGQPALEKAVFDAQVGTLVGPVRSSVGYHLLVVEERRPAPAFEEIRDRIRDDLVQDALSAFQLEVRDDTGVVYAD